MSDLNLGMKVCKYCGTYYSPEGTWHKEIDNYVCGECWNKYFDITNGSTHYHREKKKKNLFQKIYAWVTQSGRVGD